MKLPFLWRLRVAFELSVEPKPSHRPHTQPRPLVKGRSGEFPVYVDSTGEPVEPKQLKAVAS